MDLIEVIERVDAESPVFMTLGDLIADLGVRDDFFVATKVDRDVRADSESQMNDSLIRLRTDRFDLMQVHNLRGWEKSIPLLRDWKEAGRNCHRRDAPWSFRGLLRS